MGTTACILRRAHPGILFSTLFLNRVVVLREEEERLRTEEWEEEDAERTEERLEELERTEERLTVGRLELEDFLDVPEDAVPRLPPPPPPPLVPVTQAAFGSVTVAVADWSSDASSGSR
jgi:hypothetical protein